MTNYTGRIRVLTALVTRPPRSRDVMQRAEDRWRLEDLRVEAGLGPDPVTFPRLTHGGRP